MPDALLDTSVLVGAEQGRLDTEALPERAAISAITIAELHLGVLAAGDPETQARRLQTLVAVEQAFEPIPVTASVARRYAELVIALRAAGRRATVLDALIAATALAHGLVLYTQDEDFVPFPGLEQVLVRVGD